MYEAQQISGAARQNSDSFYHFSGISHLNMAKTPAQYRQTPTHHGQTPAHRGGAGACTRMLLGFSLCDHRELEIRRELEVVRPGCVRGCSFQIMTHQHTQFLCSFVLRLFNWLI